VRSEVEVEDQGASAWRGPEAPVLHTVTGVVDTKLGDELNGFYAVMTYPS
jgi:hypothetical protein